jgi:hypothetical protein
MIEINDIVKVSTGTLTVLRKEKEKGKYLCKQETERYSGVVICLESDLIKFKNK